MGRHSLFLAALLTLVLGGPSLAQEQTAEAGKNEQPRKPARESTRMHYSTAARQASTAVVDQFTRERNARNATSMSIRMPDGH